MKLSNKKLNFVIDYALCHLHASWSRAVEEDLDMSYEEFIKVIGEFSKPCSARPTRRMPPRCIVASSKRNR